MPLGHSQVGGSPVGASAFYEEEAEVILLPIVAGVAVLPTGVVLLDGVPFQFFANVSGSNGHTQAVTWESTLGQVDMQGQVIVNATEVDQAGSVTATSVDDPRKSDTATFTIKGTSVIAPDPEPDPDPPVDPGPFPEVIAGTVQYHHMKRSKIKILRLA